MIPRYDSPPTRRRYKFRPGAYALLIRDGAALVTYQAEPEPEYQLPGGGIDPGESPFQALHREVREETGWTIGPPRRIGAYRRFCFMPDYGFWAEKLCTIWLARPIQQISAPTEPAHSAHWVALSDLDHILTDPGSRAILGRVLGRASHHG